MRIAEDGSSGRPRPARAWRPGASDSGSPSASTSQYIAPLPRGLAMRMRSCQTSRASQSFPGAENPSIVPQLVESPASAMRADPATMVQGSSGRERTSMPSRAGYDHSLPTPHPAKKRIAFSATGSGSVKTTTLLVPIPK